MHHPWRIVAGGMVGIALFAASAAAAGPADVAARLRDHLAPHPRLLLDGPVGRALSTGTGSDPRVAQLRQRVIATADAALALPPLKYGVTDGRRMLSVSREARERIASLALAFRLSGDRKYLDGARRDLLTVTAFPDFHPPHFLDAAEMTAAVALGYDWLAADLSADDRRSIRAAIVDKGLRPSFTTPPPFWARGTNNWNQVCNGGMVLGALAVAEDEPDLARQVVARAVEGVPVAMREYAPDGAYPEGPTYWDYGTTYSLLMIAALNSAVGDDFGLAGQRGFLRSADYHLHLVGPTGLTFSYSDGGEDAAATASPAAFYLARYRRDPSLLWNEVKALDRHLARPATPPTAPSGDWLLLLWAGDLSPGTAPTATHYAGGGVTPVATHRSSWADDATFVAVKGGSPSTSHAHMDVGAFALEADGVRWASDPGSQSYSTLEKRHVDLWNNAQHSQRWLVFRLGPMCHNILTVAGQEQVVAGHATITRSTDAFTVVDTGPVYAGQLAAASRGVVLRPDRSVRVQDQVTATPDRPAVVRWAMFTHADVRPDGPAAALSLHGKRLGLAVLSPPGVTVSVAPADPPHDYDMANRNARLVTFEVTVPPGQSRTLVVDFTPGEEFAARPPLISLANW